MTQLIPLCWFIL